MQTEGRTDITRNLNIQDTYIIYVLYRHHFPHYLIYSHFATSFLE